MSSYAAHNLRTKKVPTSPSSPAATAKPLRPLTAYHMFFQLEREFIIQTTAGPAADPACHANKSYLPDVPRRYRAIKLNADNGTRTNVLAGYGFDLHLLGKAPEQFVHMGGPFSAGFAGAEVDTIHKNPSGEFWV